MNEQNLYKINENVKQIIDESVDKETGEMFPVVWKKLNELQLTKDEIVKQVVFNYKEQQGFIDRINKEIIRLQNLIKTPLSKQDEIIEYLSKNLTPGTAIKNEFIEITWRSSSRVVENDEFISLEQIRKNDKKAVTRKVTLTLNKMYIKGLDKKGKPIPEGISISKLNTLTIK